MTDPQIQNRVKRRKLSNSKDNPYLAHLKGEDDESKTMANPYLAHMQPDQEEDSGAYSNGYAQGFHQKSSNYYNDRSSYSNGATGTLASFPRHKTTAEMARAAEDGPDNPFTGRSLSKEYFSILKTRRDLPVQAQRYAVFF